MKHISIISAILLIGTSVQLYAGEEGVFNTYYGSGAGNTGDGRFNAFFGRAAGIGNTGEYNTYIGHSSGPRNSTGDNNTFIGGASGFLNTTGVNNTFIGRSSGYPNSTGSNNTFIGYSTGYFRSKTGSNNIFLGSSAGYYATGSNKLYIDSSNTDHPLIYGEFDNNLIRINGKFNVNGPFTANNNIGFGINDPKEAVEVLRTNTAARFQLTSITNTGNQAAQFIQRRARYEVFGPAAVENSDVIGFFSFRGWNGVDWTKTKAGISVTATEDWSETQNGNLLTISHTPNGSDTLTAALQIKGHADVYIPNGNLYVKGSKMNVPDYVFKDNYKLMPLDELKAFVQKNNHLPGVVSAEEVGKAGVVNLSGLQMTLLEKVEELTLYTLQQEEQIADQKVKIAKLEAMQKRLSKVESLLTNLALDTSGSNKEKVSMK